MTRLAFASILISMLLQVEGQTKQNPVVPSFGSIYNIPEASVKPESDLAYNIVVDVYSGTSSPKELNPALNNVARMLNLHAVGGADTSRMNVVLAIHGGATYATLEDESYKKRYGISNPNKELINELKQAGVKLTLCGQSMIGRGVDANELLPQIEIATSMLTTVSTYQLKGYAVFKF